jgi:Putative restriction endonuclease
MSAEPIDYRAVPTKPPPEGWTVADVDALPDRDGVRYELVDGVPKVMTPPCGDHQDALLELHMACVGQSRRICTSCSVSA